MKVEYKTEFVKTFKKRFARNPKIANKFAERLILFTINPANPILKDHALVGNLIRYRAFSITGDIRVIYYIKDEIAYFVDIGSHNQVYGK